MSHGRCDDCDDWLRLRAWWTLATGEVVCDGCYEARGEPDAVWTRAEPDDDPAPGLTPAERAERDGRRP